ncbi:hypothetical protein F511_08441 [Dorcoceras hygrometricum]|uniref:DNA-directed RNA polymerase III subunit RPC5 n=1 Tax=Dorcoceras hygrometricum TaxID=472368 RepID=A0A2Z7ABN0_9LAMI|nr:hypothetical protein F511_08441 [Dorcoceras hygrometricum]
MADLDFDLDELLGGPAQVPSRPTRFNPKGSKFKPRAKIEPSQQLSASSSDPAELIRKESDSIPSPKKEELGVKPEFANDVVEMDIDFKHGEIVDNEVKKEETEDLMETGEGEAEDEVVREIDVYLTSSLDPNTRLYVLQYPLRPLWRPYEMEERCEQVRVKPASNEIEVDLAIDFESKNYDRDAGSRFLMKRQTLASAWKPPHTSGYAVGLHLNPVHAVVQLRPSMEHLDSRESKRKVVSGVEGTVKAEENKEGKFSGASNQSIKPSGQEKDIAEDWIPLTFRSARSDMASRYSEKMVAQEGSAIDFSMTSYDYLNSLYPGNSNDNAQISGPPRRLLLTLPLKERFKTWLLEGPPIHRFDALKYLASDETVEEILGVLQEYARLVQGLWVPKSSLVYGTDQGIEVLARDYVLLLFTKNPLINNSQLPRRPQLAKAMRDALKVLAVERPAFNDWKLKELPDFSFMKLNPSVVKKQQEEWDCLENKINVLFGGKSGPSVTASSKFNTTNNSTPKCSDKARTLIGANSRIQMSEDAREAIAKALQKLFKSVKVCSFQQISQRLRDMAVSESARSTGFAKEAVAAANSIDSFPTELQAIVNQVAVNIHGICIPKSSPDHPQYDAFRKVVINLFVAEGPNAKLKKASIIEAAKMELKRDIPSTEFYKVVQELCISQASAWVLKTGDRNQIH